MGSVHSDWGHTREMRCLLRVLLLFLIIYFERCLYIVSIVWEVEVVAVKQGDHKPENLGNLEYSGISLNMENSGNSQGILRNLREKL